VAGLIPSIFFFSRGGSTAGTKQADGREKMLLAVGGFEAKPQFSS